ncbi:SP-RING zinc finger domain containing protein [Entamoeba marina]
MSTTNSNFSDVNIASVIAPTFNITNIILKDDLRRDTKYGYTSVVSISFPPFNKLEYDIDRPQTLRHRQKIDKNDGKKRIQFVVVDKLGRVCHSSSIELSINDKKMDLSCFSKIPTHGRFPFIEGIDITDYLLNKKNIIRIHTKIANCSCVLYQGYSLTISQTVSNLNNVLKHDTFHNNISIDLNKDDDDEVFEEQSKIVLNCPISFSRIKVPVRGKQCTHQRTFDLYSFLNVSQQSGFYICPLCSSTIQPLQLIIDKDIENILKSVDEGVDEVLITADGKFTPIQKQDISELDDDPDELKYLSRGKSTKTNDIHPQQQQQQQSRLPFQQQQSRLPPPQQRSRLPPPPYQYLPSSYFQASSIPISYNSNRYTVPYPYHNQIPYDQNLPPAPPQVQLHLYNNIPQQIPNNYNSNTLPGLPSIKRSISITATNEYPQQSNPPHYPGASSNYMSPPSTYYPPLNDGYMGQQGYRSQYRGNRYQTTDSYKRSDQEETRSDKFKPAHSNAYEKTYKFSTRHNNTKDDDLQRVNYQSTSLSGGSTGDSYQHSDIHNHAQNEHSLEEQEFSRKQRLDQQTQEQQRLQSKQHVENSLQTRDSTIGSEANPICL